MEDPGVTISTALGLLLLAVALRDIFDTLFHPEGRGTLAKGVMRAVWLLFRVVGRISRRLFALAGPTALLAIIASWAALLTVGWALIYWPHLPQEFRFDSGLEPRGALVDALNFSLVSLTTVGFGDITPVAGWLRIAAPLEALLGFALLSASISWLLLIYPALSRRRSLAYEIFLLLKAERDTGVVLEKLEPEATERLYADLTSRLGTVERDLVNLPITYYFTEPEDGFSLPALMPHLLELTAHGLEEDMPDRVRLRAAMLKDAVADFAATTSKGFHRRKSESTEELLEAYTRDHLHSPQGLRRDLHG